MRAFAGYPFTDEDIAVAGGAGYFEAAGRYVPNLFSFFKQFRKYEGPLPDDPAVLGAISAPVLVLHGSNTKPFLVTSARHVVDHVPNARVQEIPARPRRPADPSRGARTSTHGVLHASPAASLNSSACEITEITTSVMLMKVNAEWR